ncbi:serine hydrolase domain-containing protein [Pseudoxanthomonas sp. CF125]|uniref:serine hydrolase domain-containing protein n=1 Tax=Pseudoxanthomonas sp. CF125 TaxID=1855303 RepID=UPI00087E6574|nr:serine hydrolase domain-containing protein [Pseudoxanthomonas sp. CF125]SDQ84381.1 CubicO group peptidase, beta-lactamase class C family [Pseudoxanthomonas sp. CF125]
MRTGLIVPTCLSWLILAMLLGSCATASRPSVETGRGLRPPTPAVEQELQEILDKHRIVTAGLGILMDGKLAWALYHGDASPGVPANAATRFNVASITKTVTAETALRLIDAGELDLDEPLGAYWVDPDIAGDPRLQSLTARTVLTHTTGFPNWRFFRSDGKLAFARAPGEAYGYSGEGFEYLARAISTKLHRPFPQVVRELVFEPAGMQHAMMEIRRNGLRDVAIPIDEEGTAHRMWCRPNGWCREEGSYSAADDMLVTVPDYARFLAMVARDESGKAGTPLARGSALVDTGDDAVVDCEDSATIDCPRAQGYGLGFQVIEYDAMRILGHGGNDWAEVALGYIQLPARDGLIVFLNAPNRRGLEAMPELVELLDPDSPFPGQYRRWLARERAQATR